jgi:hypothetical protein
LRATPQPDHRAQHRTEPTLSPQPNFGKSVLENKAKPRALGIPPIRLGSISELD